MADANAGATGTAQSAPPRGPRGDNSRGGRGGGRGGRGPRRDNAGEGAAEGAPKEGRSPRRGRGGNRGARGRGDSSSTLTPADLAARFSQKPPAASETSGPNVSKVSEKVDEEEDPDAEVCFICASPVVHSALTPCNHRTCHICALRMRALYKTRDCAHCRVS